MFCSQCGKENVGSAKFCTMCGVALADSSTLRGQQPSATVYQRSGRRGESDTGGHRMKTRKFSCTPDQYAELIRDLNNWLLSKNFNCQQISTEDNGIALQIVKKGKWRNLIGMSSALNIVLHQTPHAVVVEIGAGKWIDKIIAGSVSAAVLWPIGIAASIGIVQQMNLPKEIYQFIEDKLK
jgi:hypothetical protein